MLILILRVNFVYQRYNHLTEHPNWREIIITCIQNNPDIELEQNIYYWKVIRCFPKVIFSSRRINQAPKDHQHKTHNWNLHLKYSDRCYHDIISDPWTAWESKKWKFMPCFTPTRPTRSNNPKRIYESQR